jgi:probable rRNA maturation factor
MSVAIEFAIESPAWNASSGAEGVICRAIDAAVSDIGPIEAEVGVVLANDARIRALNRTWLGSDTATNVLSFPAPREPDSGARFLGDLVFAFETIQREAEVEEKTFEQHLAHLAVHGVLHLLGFNHERDEDAETMEGRERRILAGLGIADPYAPACERRTERV